MYSWWSCGGPVVGCVVLVVGCVFLVVLWCGGPVVGCVVLVVWWSCSGVWRPVDDVGLLGKWYVVCIIVYNEGRRGLGVFWLC